MEDLELYLSIAATTFGLLISTLTFLTKFIKNAKAKKTLENLMRISQEIIPYIEEAESFLNYSGVEKKAYVMTKVTQLAISNKMKFDHEAISKTVDELVRLTKEVNVRNNIKKENNISFITYSPEKELGKLHG